MRVVGGKARGRALRAPAGGATRPTGDRVREAIFNMLQGLTDLDGAVVADLFAGSGALGIESVSRGAGRAVLVDSSPAAVEAIRANAQVLGDDGARAEVHRADVLRWLGATDTRFDLVLADPPYAFDETAWVALFERLRERAGLVVAESGSPIATGPGWETVKVRIYGGTVVTIVQPQNPAPVEVATAVSVPGTEEGER